MRKIRIILLFFFLLLGCKQTSNDFSFVDSGGSSADDSDLGQSALGFSPSSYDFGPLEAYSGEESVVLTVKNQSTFTILVTDFSGETDHYTILANNCIGPTLPPNGDCQVTVRFSPQAPGAHVMTLKAVYKKQSGATTLDETMGLSGSGVSPLSFDGIQSITNITHNSMRLNWNATADATSFIVFSIGGGGEMNYKKTVANSGGTVTFTEVDGLQPNTSYTWRVRGIDALGNQESNTDDLTEMTSVNSAPALAAIANPSYYSGVTTATIDARDSNTNVDTDSDGDPITYSCRYDRTIDGVMGAGVANCTSLVNEGGGSPSFNVLTGVFASWRPLHADAGGDFEFEIVGTDPYGATSAVIFSGTIQPGSPAKPTVSGISVVSPVNENNPQVYGTTEPNFDIKLYSDSSCTNQIGSGTADGDGDFSVTATVPDDQITFIYARAVNIIGNESDCSTTSATIVEDSSAPFLSMTGSTPASPSSSLNPTINGITESNSSVKIFSNSSCVTEVASGTASGGGNFSIAVSVVADTSNGFYATSTDAAGNESACSMTGVSYSAYRIGVGIAKFSGTETNAPSTSTNLNQSTPYSIKWSEAEFDYNYFSYVSASSERVTVTQPGDYFVSLTLPMRLTSAELYRPSVQAEVYVNGVIVDGSMAASTYIRNSTHYESSGHVAFLVSGLSANDVIEVRVSKGSDDGSVVQVTEKASFYVEFVNPARTIFSGTATRTTASTNLATGTNALQWTSVVKDSGFTHNNAVSSENILLDSAGHYLVSINLPIYSTTQRANVKVLVDIDGVTVSGGEGKQGYIRGDTGHYTASVHWSGVLPNVGAGSVLTIKTENAGAGGTVTVPASKKASIFVERLAAATGVFSARSNSLAVGNNWNPNTAASISWTVQSLIDSSTYTHSTGVSPQEITVDSDGDYLLIYNDSFYSTLQRANVVIGVLVNGAAVSGAETKSHYIRGVSGHNESSGSLVYLLRDLNAGDKIELQAIREGVAGQVDDDSDAILTLIKRP